VTSHGLGRIAALDSRDRAYLLRAALPTVTRRNRSWPFFAQPLDQGPTGTCVEHGWRHWGLCAPVISVRQLRLLPQYSLYREMILVDEFTDNDNDTELQLGTSVRAGAKIMQKHGFLSVYGWAFDIGTAIDWLCSQGPLVFGTRWTTGMFTPSAEGFVTDTGTEAGGHCYAAIGWSEKRGAMRFMNSWGGSWGQKGRFWMTGETVTRLLAADGECCTALEVRQGG
jgi:hypothetical protein